MPGDYSYAFPEWEQSILSSRFCTLDEDDENEIEHLLLQHRYLSRCMGGALPLDLSGVKHVLDANCGAGGWVYELAWNHPSMHVMGVEERSDYVEKGEELVRPLGNAAVMRQDMRHLSDELLPLASFDMVHARFLASTLHPQVYPATLASLVSRCRVGGLFVWDELEYPITNSAACQQLIGLVQVGLQATERAFSPGYALGITPMMRTWMQAAGCRVKLDAAFAIEVSSGTQGRDIFGWQMWRLCKRIRPLLLAAGVTTQASFKELYLQAQHEILEESFCGLLYMRTLVGNRV